MGLLHESLECNVIQGPREADPNEYHLVAQDIGQGPRPACALGLGWCPCAHEAVVATGAATAGRCWVGGCRAILGRMLPKNQSGKKIPNKNCELWCDVFI